MTNIVYVALGDSLSAGVGDTDSDGRWVGWARRTCSLLADATGATYEFTNLSLNRAMLADVRADQVPVVAGANPDLLTVTIGINDIQHAFDPPRFATQVGELFGDLVRTGATV